MGDFLHRRFISARLLALAALSLAFSSGFPCELNTRYKEHLEVEAGSLVALAQEVPPGPGAEVQQLGPTPCVGGLAGPYPCSNVDILSLFPLDALGTAGQETNDLWGWTDPLTQREYVVIGFALGTSFVDVTDPANPVLIGTLPTRTPQFSFNIRDVKVLGDHAVIVADLPGHGMQIFDMKQLRQIAAPPVTLTETAIYTQFGSVHNIAVDEESGFAYAAASDTCGAGIHMVDMNDPVTPVFAGCIEDDDTTHDLQCLVYRGPDARFSGNQICFASQEDSLNIYDVTDKSSVVRLAKLPYPCSAYVHQGWLTEDGRYFLVDDEGDEVSFGLNTTTHIFEVSDLTKPRRIGVYTSPVASSIDHNLYIHEGHAYEANYSSGLRIMDLAEVHDGILTEVAFLDTDPNGDVQDFIGAWSNYPFFDSGTIAVSVEEQGLFLLKANLDPDYILEVDQDRVEICEPGTETMRLTVRSRFGFNDLATLSLNGLTQDVSGSFDVNPVAATGSAILSLAASGAAPGTSTFTVQAQGGSLQRDRNLTLVVTDAAPSAPGITSPLDGAADVPLRPLLSWSGDPQSTRFRVEIAVDAGFTQVIRDVVVEDTMHQVNLPLSQLSTHWWRVTPMNQCGAGAPSAPAAFTTRAAPPILLVDDDDNCPDVLPDYAAALGILGREFTVWDTGNTDEQEPGAGTLGQFPNVIWFTGGEFTWTAGPGPDAEAALGNWLDQSGCLLIDSENYFGDKGLTPFMQNHLGVASANRFNPYMTVTGSAPIFSGLGPYTLSPPYGSFSDILAPRPGLASSFVGETGSAGVTNAPGHFLTSFWGFGLEGLPTAADRVDALGAFLAACDLVPVSDGDGDGEPNQSDCLPADPTVTSAPGPVRDVRFATPDGEALEWLPPLVPGSLVPLYDVLRSDSDPFFSPAACLGVGITATTGATPSTPPPGTVLNYLIRVRNLCGENLGTDSLGTDRTAGPCQTTCGNGQVEAYEACDGTLLQGETCQDQGFDAGTLECLGTCDGFDVAGCTTVCGDGVRRGDELCDGTDVAGETCESQGFDGGTLGCGQFCDVFDYSGCTTICGDSVARGFEVCDGTDLQGESCVSQGFDGGSLECLGTCDGFDVAGCTTVCGDGVRRGNELCDGTDTGTTSCLDIGFDGGVLGCDPTCSSFDTSACTTCGDGIREGDEACDTEDLNGETCRSLGHLPGTLACSPTCSFDFSGCTGH